MQLQSCEEWIDSLYHSETRKCDTLREIISNLNKETLIISSSSDIKKSDSYKKLLSIGERLIPNLLESLKTDNNISICMLISDIGDIKKLKDFYLNEFNR